jgi:transcriptional regulator with XRE-family HTH domain
VAKFHNKKETNRVGTHVKKLREEKEFTIEDISDMTGFARNTIISFEKGANTDTSHLIEIAKAIGVHPKELLDIPFDIKPRYKLSPKRIARNRLTLKINKLYSATKFFEEPRFVRDVIAHLSDYSDIKATSAHTSSVLKRMADEGKLRFIKVGRQNKYIQKKK